MVWNVGLLRDVNLSRHIKEQITSPTAAFHVRRYIKINAISFLSSAHTVAPFEKYDYILQQTN